MKFNCCQIVFDSSLKSSIIALFKSNFEGISVYATIVSFMINVFNIKEFDSEYKEWEKQFSNDIWKDKKEIQNQLNKHYDELMSVTKIHFYLLKKLETLNNFKVIFLFIIGYYSKCWSY